MSLKSLVKRISPAYVRSSLRKTRHFLASKHISRARSILDQASGTPSFLDYQALVRLDKEYPSTTDYRMQEDGFSEQRGIQRAHNLLKSLPGAPEQHQRTLEVGCGSGVVSMALQAMGKQATAIDINNEEFDPRGIDIGVDYRVMNAEQMTFDDNSFDLVFSEATFEHITNPGTALNEALRVVKPSGYVQVDFGPLYYAPFGLHAYNYTGIPYCHVLFSIQDLNTLLHNKGIEAPIDQVYVNKKRLAEYRALWTNPGNRFTVVSYEEFINCDHLKLIQAYPSCFKDKSADIEDFIVSSISFLMRKEPN